MGFALPIRTSRNASCVRRHRGRRCSAARSHRHRWPQSYRSLPSPRPKVPRWATTGSGTTTASRVAFERRAAVRYVAPTDDERRMTCCARSKASGMSSSQDACGGGCALLLWAGCDFIDRGICSQEPRFLHVDFETAASPWFHLIAIQLGVAFWEAFAGLSEYDVPSAPVPRRCVRSAKNGPFRQLAHPTSSVAILAQPSP